MLGSAPVELAPFLSSDDPVTRDLANGLIWMESVLGSEAVATRIRQQAELRGPSPRETFDTLSAGATQDLFGWQLFNCHAFLFDPTTYDTNAGARIVPTVVALGARAPVLAKIPGAADRLRASAEGASNFEKTAFELLVAAAYAASGWLPEFVPPSALAKTPELQTKSPVNGERVFVECKRLSKNSGYAQLEREKWMRLVQPVALHMRKRALPVLLDIVFHTELVGLPDDYLETILAPKLELAVPGLLVDSPDLTVSLRATDLRPIQKEVEHSSIKTNGSRINHLVFGSYDPARGYHLLVGGQPNERHPLFMKTIDFAAGAVWSCDAARSHAAKARDIRSRLAEAVRQLPDGAPGVVHFAVESYDGPTVERIRNQRITRTLGAFKTGKDLRVVYVHLLTFDSPPDMAWDMQETVYVTTFAPGAGATALDHELSPYRLHNHHAWTFNGAAPG